MNGRSIIISLSFWCKANAMGKSIFFEIAVKVLAKEATQYEKDQLDSYLKDEKYAILYTNIKKEWDKEYKLNTTYFDYKKGLKRLRNKIRKEEAKAINEKRPTKINWALAKIAAAIFLIIVLGVTLSQKNKKHEIVEFADANKHEISTGNTRLILQGKKEIQIETEDSEINYINGKKGNVRLTVNAQNEIVENINTNEISFNTVIVPYGKRSKIILTDNTTVWLNSGSKFIYPTSFSKKKREVFLDGEALFDVEHQKDTPFKVITNNLGIKVLGTVFNVSAYSDDSFTSTVLECGRVEINYEGKSVLKKRKLIIDPGTCAQYDPETKAVTQKKVNTKYYTSWCEGILIYQNECLEEIIKKLKRYYNKEITVNKNDLLKRKFSGKLDLKEDVADVLTTISYVSSLKIDQSNNQYIIKE